MKNYIELIKETMTNNPIGLWEITVYSPQDDEINNIRDLLEEQKNEVGGAIM